MIGPTPLISIITPTFNSARTIERTIHSVLSQDYPQIDYHIVDGGSTDGTLDILKKYESRLTWTSAKDEGVADAFNIGIKRSRGEVIGIVNADDYYELGVLNLVAQTLADSNGDTIFHGQIRYYNDRMSRILSPWPMPRKAMWLDLPFNHPSYFVPRVVYDRIGLYDTKYKIAMDYDFTLRAMQAGVKFRYVPRLISHFQIGGLASSDPRATHREVLRSQLEHGEPALICRTTFAAKMTINSLKRFFLGAPSPRPIGAVPAPFFTAGLQPNRPPALVSIIIPIYNSSLTLQRTLDSLLRIAPQHRDAVHIQMIDDGSTDDSVAIVERWRAQNHFPMAGLITQPNGGTSAARNMGLNSSIGEWVFFLDSDDELMFDPMPFAARANPDITCLAFAVKLRKGGWVYRWGAQVISPVTHLDAMTSKCPYYPPNLLIRRRAIDRLFDTSLRTLEDWHWFTTNPRIFEKMQTINGVTSAIVHVHGGNKTAQFSQRGKDRTEIASRLLNELIPTLTKKQQSNLLLQADIGRVQTGEPVSWTALGRWPCDLSLLAKGAIYFVFRKQTARIDPYSSGKSA